MAPKYQKIADELRVQIEAGKYADAEMLPTEFAIAQEYQVSRQTVRQALAVLVRDRMIEKRQGSGSRILRGNPPPKQRYSIAVVTTYISDYIFPGILREVEKVFSENNCTPSLFATQNQVGNERKILSTLLEMPVDGILVEGSKTALPNPNLDLYHKFIERGIPLVFMHGDYQDLSGVLSVMDDNRTGGHQLVEYLYQKGHREIAGIFKSDDIQGLQRYGGYMDALRDFDLPMEAERIFWYNTENKERVLAGEAIEQVERVLKGCSAVICYNDEIASHLVGHFMHDGIRVPEDLAVVSFDDSQYSNFSSPRITSLSHGAYNVGRMAAELLVRQLRGEPCHSEWAPWVLVEKESG